MTQRRTNPAYLNGVPELLLLHLLSRRPMYGYELVQAIRHETGEVQEARVQSGQAVEIGHRSILTRRGRAHNLVQTV